MEKKQIERVGIFGGSFDPPHLGHLSCLQDVVAKTGLDRVILIPAYQNPLKAPIEGPSPDHRLAMTRIAIQDWGSQFSVDDREIQRGGLSYTCETVASLRQDGVGWYLILGVDHLSELDRWKNVDSLFDEVHWIMISRPGFDFPKALEDLPLVLSQRVESWDFNTIRFRGGKTLQFLHVREVPVSSSEIRKALRSGRGHLIASQLPLAVEQYIKENHLYVSLEKKISDFEGFTSFCSQILSEKKGIQVRAFDLRGGGSEITDFALIASGTSTRHTTALGENLIQSVKERYNVYPMGTEGLEEGRWVVLDYGSLMVHLFYDFVRHEYALEQLWKSARPVL